MLVLSGTQTPAQLFVVWLCGGYAEKAGTELHLEGRQRDAVCV